MGTNIGRVVLKCFLRDKSPFTPQPLQEYTHYFDPDTYNTFYKNNSTNISAVPSPINGFRLTEYPNHEHNFLCDTTGVCLGESGEESSVAAVRFAAKILSYKEEKEKDFFTWIVSNNIFQIKDPENPPPRSFASPPSNDSAPEFTYIQPLKYVGAGTIERPSVGNYILTPFMRKNPPDTKRSVHWGAKMKTALAINQPFQVVFNFTKRDPIVPSEAEELTPRYKFVNLNGEELPSLNLTRSIYFMIEMGIGSIDHYMILFKQASEPMFFVLRKDENTNTSRAILLSTFTGVNKEKILDLNHKYMTVSVEPVAGNLIIRSNLFGEIPWVVFGGSTAPLFIGNGPLGVYGGNVQVGWAMLPITYAKNGEFTTPKTPFTIFDSSNSEVACTTALKGSGEVEQDKTTFSEDPFSSPKLHAVDAEQVNNERVKSIVEALSKRPSQQSSVHRIIRTTLKEEDDPNTDPNAQLGFGSVIRTHRVYSNTVKMLPGYVVQGNGYVVKNGRSPYIWRLNCSVPQGKGVDPHDVIDVSCDVMSVDLNWNATSYNEIVHSGTLRLLNRRQPSPDNPRGPLDYREFLNRSVYLRIEAYWEIGAGHDPKNDKRQVFEGLTVGATVETKAENEVIVFKIEDYMNVLQNSKFVQSPAYDGMSASLAIQDIVGLTGLSKARILRNNTQMSSANLGRDLGLSLVNITEKPKFRFRDGSSYKDAILQFARLDFKTVYFDHLGRFHLDDVPGGVFGDVALPDAVKFWTSPRKAIAAGEDSFLARLIWNSITFSRNINDVYNVISVKSADKLTQARISAADAYSAGIFDPRAEGYVGYRKHLVLEDAAYGSVEAVYRTLDNYRRRVFIPPLTARFGTYGYSGIKPLDLIQVDGQYLRVMNIQRRISAQDNNYWMEIEGEWFFGTGKGQDPSLTETEVNDIGSEDTSLDPATASTL